MPLVDFNDSDAWAQMYDPPFERANRELIFGNGMVDCHKLRTALEERGMQPHDSVLFIGGGYGWMAEAWASAGYTRLTVSDSSDRIHSTLAGNAVIPICNEDALTAESRECILAAAGVDRFDWIITEDVLPCLTDGECLNLAQCLRLIGTRVVHWLTPKIEGNTMPLNWRTAQEWSAMMSPDIIAIRGTSEAL